MKRDIDLVRTILLTIEAGGPDELDYLEIEGRDQDEVNYHLALLADADLIEAERIPDRGRLAEVRRIRMRWHGHEFLDNARNAEVWSMAKSAMDKAGGFSLEVMKSILVKLASNFALKLL